MDDLNDKTVLILGLGASGLAMARWCAGRGARVRVWDSRANPPQAGALGELPDAGFFSGELAAAAAEGVARIYKSPGLSPNDARLVALLAEARRAGVPVRGELDLFSEALAELKAARGYAPKVLAITGTNGKTTTTSLTGQLVARAGRRVAVAGNIGPTMLDTLAAAIREQDEADRIAAEEAAAKAAAEAEEAAARTALEAAEAQAAAAVKAQAEADKPAKKTKAAKAAAADEASVAVDAPALDPLPDDVALGNEAADPAAIHAESIESAQADAEADTSVALAAGDERPVVDDETSVIAAIDEPQALVDAGTDAELAGEDDELVVDAEELRELAAHDGATLLDAQAEADAGSGELADEPAPDAAPIEPALEATPATSLPDDDAPTIALVAPPPPEPVFSHLPQVWVLELSSFQLDGVHDFVPSAATVLNVTQDHLDWHGDMPAYAAAKARVFGTGAMPATVMVVNRDEPAVEAMVPPPVVVKPTQRGQRSRTLARRLVRFGLDAPHAPGDFGLITENGMAWLVRAMESDPTLKRKPGDVDEIVIQRLMPADALRIRGRHNASNALAALALASAVGVPLAPMLHGLREYRGEPHRVETIGVVDGIEFIDDSKGTNVGATVAALDGLGADRAPGKLAVILGGDGKGQDFAPLAEPLRRHARAAATIGKDAAALEAVLQSVGVPFERHATLEAATRWALAQAQPGDAVLLSPACASLDMFRDYAHRAQVFAQAMNAIAEGDAGVPAADPHPGGWQ